VVTVENVRDGSHLVWTKGGAEKSCHLSMMVDFAEYGKLDVVRRSVLAVLHDL